jgi:galactonate dehydratase
LALKVTDIKTFVVDGGFRPWTFVKIETSDPGVVGWGDCTDWGAPGPITAMVERLSEFVVGRDPMQVEAIWWDLHNASMRHIAGIASKGMSGIDSALWDIRGKVLNAPVWQLLGGKMRDELRLYWSHCGSTRAREKLMTDRLGITKRVETTDDIRELAQEVKDRGYTAIKTNMIKLKDRPDAKPIRPGRGSAAHAGDAPASARRNAAAVVGTFREALGPDIGIAIDVAFSFKLGGAIKLAQTLEPFDMMWLETETFDAEALRVIRDSTTTTICTGESIFGTIGYRPFLQNYSQDIIMPDLAWNGITMGKKIADLANAYDTLFAPHNCHSPINTLVSAAVCATVPNFFIQEFDVDDAPWRDDLMTHPFEIKNGHLQITDRPGLGSELIEGELLKHPAIEYPGAR